MTLLAAIDLTLVALVVGLATACLSTTDLFRAIVLFVALGLVVALVWGRLGAVDVALAEAAVGAGLTGALLLSAWRAIQPPANEDPPPDA